MIYKTLYLSKKISFFNDQRSILNEEDQKLYVFKNDFFSTDFKLLNHQDEVLYTYSQKWSFLVRYEMFDRLKKSLCIIKVRFRYNFMLKDYIDIKHKHANYKMLGKPNRLLFKLYKDDVLVLEMKNTELKQYKRCIDLYVEDDIDEIIGVMFGAIAAELRHRTD